MVNYFFSFRAARDDDWIVYQRLRGSSMMTSLCCILLPINKNYHTFIISILLWHICMEKFWCILQAALVPHVLNRQTSISFSLFLLRKNNNNNKYVLVFHKPLTWKKKKKKKKDLRFQISQNFVKFSLRFCLISQILVHSLWHEYF